MLSPKIFAIFVIMIKSKREGVARKASAECL